MNWIIATLIVVCVAGVAGAAYVNIAGKQFDGRIVGLRADMIAAQRGSSTAAGGLPDIVLTYALKAGGTIGGPTLIYAQHKATLASARDKPVIPLHAEQWTGTRTPGIVWKAQGTMTGIPVTVVDSYVAGSGLLEARLFGAVLVSGGTGPDYDKGELMRYLSELPVYPDAILNAVGLTWRQIDARTVEVSAQSQSERAAIRFIFDANGDIARMEADDRPMTVDGKTVPTPWHGIYADYKRLGGYRIPTYGEVGWALPDGFFTYWKGEVVAYEAKPDE